MSVLFGGFIVLVVFEVLYVFVMSLRERIHTLPLAARTVAYLVAAVGIALDVAINVLASPVFLQSPQEWTLSTRMCRYRNAVAGTPLERYRQRLANWVLENFVLPFDRNHCS